MISLLLAGLLAQSAGRPPGVQAHCPDGEPEARSVLQVPNNFCGRLQPGDKAGRWWCLNGDGSQPVGSVPLTPSGNATSAAPTICRTGAVFGTTTKYSTANMTPPPSGVTICAVTSMSNYTAVVDLASHGSFGGGTYSATLVTSGGGVSMISKNSSATVLFTSGFGPPLNSWVVLCGTYSAADGKARSYLNGVLQGTTTAQSPVTLSAVNVPWNVGASAVVSYGFAGAFMVEQVLSDARIAQLSRVCN